MTPKGYAIVAHVPEFVKMYGIWGSLARMASRHST
jgi:hypothetical protein